MTEGGVWGYMDFTCAKVQTLLCIHTFLLFFVLITTRTSDVFTLHIGGAQTLGNAAKRCLGVSDKLVMIHTWYRGNKKSWSPHEGKGPGPRSRSLWAPRGPSLVPMRLPPYQLAMLAAHTQTLHLKLFPGLPTIQFLIVYSIQKLDGEQTVKSW